MGISDDELKAIEARANDIPALIAHIRSQDEEIQKRSEMGRLTGQAIAELESDLRAAREALRELLEAMKRYEYEVDEPPTYAHRNMIKKARKALGDSE